MTDKWKDSSLSLGERCVAFAENEMANGVAEDHPGSYTSPRLREYFSICTRLVNGKETHINFTAGNWCAASASYCLRESLLPGEVPPHGYRLGVVEVVADLQHNSLYQTVTQVRKGTYQIKKGDVVIFDRSVPNNPATAWYRHIGRVYSVGDQGNYQCISGNSGGHWKISSHNISQSNLLGFGVYPELNVQVVPGTGTIADWSNFNLSDLAPSTDTGHDLAIDHIGRLFNALK